MLRASSSTTRTLLRRRQQQQTLLTDLSLLQSTTATSCCSSVRRGLIQRPLSSASSSVVLSPLSDSTSTPRLYASNSYQTALASRCLVGGNNNINYSSSAAIRRSSTSSELAALSREVATRSGLLEIPISRQRQPQQQLIALPQLQQQLLIYSRLNSITNNHNYNQQWRREFSTKAAQKSAVSSAASTVSNNLDNASDEESEKNKKIAAASVSVSGIDVSGISSAPKQQDVKTTKASSPSTASSSSPTKKASPSTSTSTETSILQKATSFLQSALKTLLSLILKTPGVIYFYLTHPTDLKAKLHELKEHAKHEANHYWMGSKLLAADVRTARHILGRTFRGSPLSRRERKQLLRTATDVFRLVPMSIFVLVPFMEFALPFALKIFPDMLPSTFRDGLKEEEKMKRELAMRISMAGFFQDSLTELAKEQKKAATEKIRKHDDATAAADGAPDDDDKAKQKSKEIIAKEASAASFLEFLKKARTGQAIPPELILNFAKYFEDNLTLDNMGRMQLINLCKYMGIPPYGSNDLLRFYLRHRIRTLKDDDQRITWEGIDSLTKMELREACRERGMRSTGLHKEAYRAALQEWLDLSVHKNVPISLLIMSRTFYLHDEMVNGPREVTGEGMDDYSSDKGMAGLADAMSGIDKEVLNEIVLEMASSEEKSKNADVMKIQLEVLEHQNELIKEEQEERDAAAKEKEEEEKKKKEMKAKVVVVDSNEKEVAAFAVEAKGGEVSVKKVETMDDETVFSKTAGDDSQKKDKTFASVTEFDSMASPLVSEEDQKAAKEEEAEIAAEEEQTELSTEEIDAISQLASPDPVQKEREELQRIKDAMRVDEEEGKSPVLAGDQQLDDAVTGAVDQKSAEASLEISSAICPSDPIQTEEAQEEAVKSIKECEEAIEKEAEEVTVISMDGEITDGTKKELEEAASVEDAAAELEEGVGDAKLQKAIDRLKSRVESMVGKIETQLTDVERKIGDKFHLLDKDGDGVLTMEEMASVLQTVLKRELTSEEARAIAADIDLNKDGLFSVSELAQWCETNTIVKLAEDGREKDVDDFITERVQERRKLKDENDEWTGM